MSRIRMVCAGLFALVLVARAAGAEPTEADKAKARTLMDQGDALIQKKSLAAALQKYREADSIMHVTSTGIEVARTLAKLGRLLEARRVARAVAALPQVPNEPEPFTKARNAAQALAHDLDARIPQVSVETDGVPAGATLSLTIDGEPVAANENASPHDVDPGTHDLVAEAGGASVSARVTLKERDRRTLTLRFESATPSPHHDEGPPRKSGSHSPTLGYVIGGVGLAGLAVAGVTSLVIVSNDKTIKSDCPTMHCDQDTLDKISSQKSLLVVNAVAWGVGIVGTGLGAYLILSNDGKEETALAPSWSPAGPSVSLRHTF